MSRDHSTIEHVFPAGEYWIGDPCYFIEDDRGISNNWSTFLDRIGYFGHHKTKENGEPAEFYDGIYTYKGLKCFAYETYWGDGCFEAVDSETGEVTLIGVDAGVIGIMPILAIDMETGWAFNKTFDKPFTVCRMSDGTFIFGSIQIDTQGS